MPRLDADRDWRPAPTFRVRLGRWMWNAEIVRERLARFIVERYEATGHCTEAELVAAGYVYLPPLTLDAAKRRARAIITERDAIIAARYAEAA